MLEQLEMQHSVLLGAIHPNFQGEQLCFEYGFGSHCLERSSGGFFLQLTTAIRFASVSCTRRAQFHFGK